MLDFVMQNARYALIGVGMLVVGLGWASQSDVDQGINLTMTAGGALITAGTWLYGLYVKWNTKSVPLTTAVRADVPTVSPVTGSVQTGNTFTG